MIQYVTHKKIDFAKWDYCIEHAVNSLPYAYSWYLTLATDGNWDALILNDYEAVFPLPYQRRVLFKQIYQPFFIQQLGLFAIHENDLLMAGAFVNAIPKKFRKIYLHINSKNTIDNSKHRVTKRVTHLLYLSTDYASIAKKYITSVRRNLKNANKFNLQFDTNYSPQKFIDFIKQNLNDKLKGIKDDDYIRFEKIIHTIIERDKGSIKAVTNSTHDVLAAAFIINSNKHIIYLMGASNQQGRRYDAMTFLINSFFEQYAGSDLAFDFEGSMIKSIADFYKSFGAEAVTYYSIKKNLF